MSDIDNLGAERSRQTVHDRGLGPGQQSVGGNDPGRITGNETMIRIDDQRFRLSAAANSKTTEDPIRGALTHSARFHQTCVQRTA
jgi:hypothetical protein